MELADVVLIGIPLVYAVALLHSVDELPLVVGDATVDLTGLPAWQVVLPVALVKQFGC
jgi:hypothetical protein